MSTGHLLSRDTSFPVLQEKSATSKTPLLREMFLLPDFPQPQKIIRLWLAWLGSSLLPAVLIPFRLSEVEDNSVGSESIDWAKSGHKPHYYPFAAMCNRRGECIFSRGNLKVWLVLFQPHGKRLFCKGMQGETLKPQGFTQLSELFACHSKFHCPSLFFVVYLFFPLWKSPGKSGKWSKHPRFSALALQ